MFVNKANKFNILIEYLFYIFIFLLPLQTRYIIETGKLNGYWEYGTYCLYGTDVLLAVLIILSLFYKNQKNNKLKNKAIFCPHKILMGTFLLISFFSLYWSLNQELGFYYWLRLLSMAGLMYLIHKLNVAFRKISWAMILSGVGQAALGIWQFFSQQVVACKWLGMSGQAPETLGVQVVENADGRWLRAYGALPHPNILGGFLVIGILLAIYLYLQTYKNHNKKYITKIVLLVCFVIMNIGLFFSFSRSAWLALFVALIFIGSYIFIYKINKSKKINFLKLLIFFLIVYVPLMLIYNNLFFSRFDVSQKLEQQSISQRVDYQKQSLVLIKKYWPTGIGIGNYTQTVHDKLNDDLENYQYQPVHNIYLLIFAETGLFGLLTMMLIIVNAFKNINLQKSSSVFITAVLMAMLVIGFFDHYIFTLNFGLLLFWLTVGLLNKEDNIDE